MVATAATPLWAAPGERVRTAQQDGDDSVSRPQRAERQVQRVERQQERQVQRVERQQVVQQQQVVRDRSGGGNQGSWQGRRGGGDGAAQTQQSWQGRRGGGDGSAQTQQSWRDRRGGGDNGGRDGYRQRIEESRAASQASASDGSAAVQRQAAENQARYERSRRGGDRDRGDWRRGDRDGRDGNWSRNGNWDRDGRDGRNRWDRNWRNDNRYDWQRYRYSNRDIFRRGGYYAPYRNHRYNRLSIGFILGSAFFGQNYWISDPWYYRLPPAYPGTRWVRYYDDVLLIDVYTGEVIDVIYDFFW